MKHDCHFCAGERDHDGTKCLGCGMPVTKCSPRETVSRKKNCPVCNDQGPLKEISFERFHCRKCGVVMERQDFGFVDDRPEVNAMKKEEHGRRKTGGRRNLR